jgi:hypothetical protein
MVHAAGEVLVEDERYAGCIAKAAIPLVSTNCVGAVWWV